jgi:hypothetical protein
VIKYNPLTLLFAGGGNCGGVGSGGGGTGTEGPCPILVYLSDNMIIFYLEKLLKSISLFLGPFP